MKGDGGRSIEFLYKGHRRNFNFFLGGAGFLFQIIIYQYNMKSIYIVTIIKLFLGGCDWILGGLSPPN